MRFFTVAASLAFAVSPALAHFTLSFPDSRGANHETQASSPCGGLNSVVLPRTSIDPDGSPILTSSSHAASGYEVNFCLGNDCVDAASFNYSIVDPLLIVGSGNFCISAVDYESEVWNGSSVNGTIQVIYLSDDGELYNCADVTLTLSGADSSSLCVNSTGISTSAWEGSLAASEQAAGLDSDGSAASASSSSTSSSTSSSHSTASATASATASSTTVSSSSAATSSAASTSSVASADSLVPSGILGAVVAVLGYLVL
ncbi:uncharacterized protein V2V93DRAFT_373417 [Kockiozyma suomiensis]|uniref:uncharacterized protein n=1 Tax=Kockiozyma suomiensis TaxID=1337062 RepID=UPI0033430136